MTFKNAGADASKLRYVAYDAGGSAMAAVLAGETQAISTGFGEAMEAVKSGQMRILGVTSDKRLPGRSRSPPSASRTTPPSSPTGAVTSPPHHQPEEIRRVCRPAQADVRQAGMGSGPQPQ